MAGATSGVRTVWALSDSDKVMRDDLGSPLKDSNSVWDGRRVSLFAARNEIVAFQVVVETAGGGVAALSVSLDGLSLRNGDARIAYKAPGDDPTDYLGRDIEIFSQNYMYLEKPSQARWIAPLGSPCYENCRLGWTPVQLVPENAAAARGGFPLSVPPKRNQAFWIDIYVGRELPAGLYDGVVTVSADGEAINLPVELTVFDFALPEESSLPAMIYFEPQQTTLYQGKDLSARYHRFAHRNRVEFVHAYGKERALEHRGRLDGKDFTPANSYAGPGVSVGNTIIPLTFYGPIAEYADKSVAWPHSDEWMTFLDENFPDAITFMYMPDEPREPTFGLIRELADNIHSNPGPGKRLPVFVTTHPQEGLSGAIDIWCVGMSWYVIADADAERGKGKQVWTYNGARPQSGAMAIDNPATDPRVIPWQCFKHGVEVYFYWIANHWEHNHQKPDDRIQNVWAEPITFDNRRNPHQGERDKGFFNGDGVLVYPGQDILHPEEDRGIEGPCSSIRMANLRRGLQDHLYLTMARELGLDDVVEETLRAIVPKVFSDVTDDDPVAFAEMGDEYEAARRKLAEAIEAARAN